MSDSPASVSVFRAVTRAPAVYNLALGTVLGSTVWHSFIGGPIAYKSLPRQSFGHLQSRLFPPFFALQSTASAVLLGFYARAGKLSRATLRTDRNLWLLVTMLATGVANWAVVGPWTSSVMKRRHRKERLENKDYNDPSASDSMKALNRLFGKLHGVSSLLNLAFLLAAVGHSAKLAVEGSI
ncbi:hypothetical protein JCM8097_001318 [Rhodosporidiobolus ruineniae]